MLLLNINSGAQTSVFLNLGAEMFKVERQRAVGSRIYGNLLNLMRSFNNEVG